MRWFRDHIRRSAWLALVALAINLGLSFGHVHAVDARGFGHQPASQIAAIGLPDGGQVPPHHDGDQVDLLCPICMAAGAIAHALASTPPEVPLALACASIDLPIEAGSIIPQPPRAAYHSRGPPIS